MVYKIYPVKEKEWLRIWKKIKRVAKETGMCISGIDCEDYVGQCDLKDFRMNSGQTTIIRLAEQQSLFPLPIRKVSFPKRDPMGRFIKNNP